AWDILTLIAWWNLYGLPALLIVVALVVAIRQYNRPAAGSKQELSDDSRAHPLAACRSALDHREFDSSGGRGRLARSLAERALGIGGAPPMMVLIMLQVFALMGAGPLDDQSVEVIAPGATLEKLWGEGEFTEGGAMAEDGSILFSDIGDRIMKYDPGTGKATV